MQKHISEKILDFSNHFLIKFNKSSISLQWALRTIAINNSYRKCFRIFWENNKLTNIGKIAVGILFKRIDRLVNKTRNLCYVVFYNISMVNLFWFEIDNRDFSELFRLLLDAE